MNIGIVYVKGSLPGFENFGNLPTHTVKQNGFVNGNKASNELDGLIIPGGTLLESGDISDDLKNEIKSMANDGKPILGICSGFQVLGKKTDIGRNSPCPIEKEGLGLIDVNFSPLISSDRVEAKICNTSFLSNNIHEIITGFHSHTYGKIEGSAKPLFYSKIQRMNYDDVNKKNKFNLLSGAIGDLENVVGTLIHNVLDENPNLKNNFLSFIDASEKDISYISSKNKEFKNNLLKEIGISSNIQINNSFFKYRKNKDDYPNVIMIGSTGSDSGKTFITTGLAGALRRRGLNVGIIKIGPDVRDIIPGLYLTKGLMEDYSSTKIGNLGWMDIKDILENLKISNYDIVLIEGVMSVFTGLLNEKIPFSSSEIAASSNIPMLLISGVNKGGIESASLDIIAHVNILKQLNINVKGIILNKVYSEEIFNNMSNFIKNKTGIEDVLSIEKIKLEKRGATPEIEINYDEFGKIALKTVEKYLNIEKIINMTRKPKFNRYLSFIEIKNKFS